jgi:group I intron endonuclease
MIGTYSIYNLETEVIEYIGQSKDIKTRWVDHRYRLRKGTHDNSILQKKWNFYGEDAFMFRMLQQVVESTDLSDEEISKLLDELEDEDFKEYKPICNICPAGQKPPVLKGERNPWYKIGVPESTRRAVSKAKKGCIGINVFLPGNTPWNVGHKGDKYKPHTPEMRAATSKRMMGNKNGVGNAGPRKISMEQRQEIKSHIAEGKLTYTAIAKMYGVTQSLINMVANNKRWVSIPEKD